MKRVIKNIAVAAAITATGFASTAPAFACGGSRPRVVNRYSGYQSGYSSNYAYSRPTSYSVPVQPSATYRYPSAVQQSQPVAQVTRQSAAPQTVPPQAQVQNNTAATRPSTPQTVQPAKPATVAPANTNQNAEVSALAALAALAGTPAEPVAAASTNPVVQQAPIASQPTAEHVGTFRATLPSKLAVDLQLTAEGTFSWTVDNNGTPKSFSGQYQLDGGQLTLVRSNDQQKMVGVFVQTGSGFKFTLQGANNGGLEFQRV
ncbi:hypothetical protein LOC67_10035 [Stieleria sp. JC731]|uniref:hypothetical protein n=1 Tax=Pirellulaceae TaxID=2691357 RepID=UPI001E515B16|nr:hypothetical protein [Stieleria sp. JC731]MCC9600906.1 hypothetical protein [Stieleria sp. JC731]